MVGLLDGLDVALLRSWGLGVLLAVFGLVASLIAYRISFAILKRLSQRSKTDIDNILLTRARAPLRWVFLAIGLSWSLTALPLSDRGHATAAQMSFILAQGLAGWLFASVLTGVRDIILRKADITQTDNLAARRLQTRVSILHRIALIIVAIIVACMMLMSIPALRSLGVTLFASAGLIGLAVGAAAQPALKNLISGIQLAFTEPIRLDDVVIVEGEWGRIEQIHLTYVVVKVWDERRLIVPISKFLEDTFQNWTREGSSLLGTAFVYADYAADVAALRQTLQEIVAKNPLWDGRVCGLQVTNLTPDTMELRCLVSGANAGDTFDLRCDVREAMMAHIARSRPAELPVRRLGVRPTDTAPYADKLKSNALRP